MTTKTGVFKSYKVFGKSRFFAVLFYFLEHICFRISVNLEEMSLEALQAIEPQIKPDIIGLLSVASAAAARTSFGGTAPDEVRARIADARQRFAIQ